MQCYRFKYAGDDAGELPTTIPHEFEAASHTAAFAEKDKYLDPKMVNGVYIDGSMEVHLDDKWWPVPDNQENVHLRMELLGLVPLEA